MQHPVVSREEWLAARLALLREEKELTRRSDELARRRQELPWVRVDKEYRFETDDGSASLSDLFRGRSQLLVYHLMFGPDYWEDPERFDPDCFLPERSAGRAGLAYLPFEGGPRVCIGQHLALLPVSRPRGALNPANPT